MPQCWTFCGFQCSSIWHPGKKDLDEWSKVKQGKKEPICYSEWAQKGLSDDETSLTSIFGQSSQTSHSLIKALSKTVINSNAKHLCKADTMYQQLYIVFWNTSIKQERLIGNKWLQQSACNYSTQWIWRTHIVIWLQSTSWLDLFWRKIDSNWKRKWHCSGLEKRGIEWPKLPKLNYN